MQNEDDKTRLLADKTQVQNRALEDKTRLVNKSARDMSAIIGTQSGRLSTHLRLNDITQQVCSSVNSVSDLLPGAVIKQRFKLEKSIGRGGMGTIFLATDLRKEELRDKDPYVAIKFLNEELHDSVEAVVALQREARKSQALSHPNIVTVYDFDRENDIFYLSMEYLRGESFDQYISRGANRLQKHVELMRYVEFMARGLAYAHQEGFVHADFKPANVFLTEQEQIKILDFGIAQAVRSNLAAAHPNDSLFDPVSMGALTPNYASLEMLNQERPIPADDVYALAVVAYELLGGCSPFQLNGKRITAKQAFDLGLQAAPIPSVPKKHMAAILKGLSFKREDRFADAGKFIDAIKPKVKMRKPVLAIIVALVVAVLVSWGIAVNKTEVVISVDDLPSSMSAIVETIKTADVVYEQGDIDQAHKLYVQAWEAGVDNARADSRELYKLKVILDRRINKITENLMVRVKDKDLSLYSAMQLQLTLEFLKQDDLGTVDSEIENSLNELQKIIERKEAEQ